MLCLSSGRLVNIVIFRFLATVTLAGVLAGCTADWDSRQGRLSAKSGQEQQATEDAASSVGRMPQVARSHARGDFASLPDRGELAAYDSAVKPRISGAYTAYAVRLSEEHALNAARPGGHLSIRAPDGEAIDLVYERHVEHPDGNWTWIGRDAKGADAVITFGEEAAFGTIPQASEDSLRLTLAGGRLWLVVTDRNRIGDIDRAVTRSGQPDYLIPPKMAAEAALDKASTVGTSQTVSATAIAPAAVSTVDVVLGYTTGLAAALGGDSQAVTRLNNLIEIGNQAYANSGVNATLRLVGTVSVSYTDASDNGDTLEKLSGYKSGTGPITPDPAFAALRAARETNGADLVSLVRDFRTPQNNGCGIAWLIGADQSGIETSDAPFGYSVVSDGSDLDEGDNQTYFCRDESLVHEIGHNMGQAHNVEDSSGGSGVHAYSYGYRETSTNGFYTVMAYRIAGSNQFAIRHFANPAVNYNGRATGVANASDNTRSMNQTIPVVASFRTLSGPIVEGTRNDVNGDGRSDLLWSNPGAGLFVHWLMNGAAISAAASHPVDSNYDAIGSGDIDGNGLADVIWRHRSNGQIYAWMRTANGYSVQYITALTGWTLVGVGDVNDDGKADLLWSNPGAGLFVNWLMNGSTIAAAGAYSVDGSYDVIGTGDIDGNGLTDLIWRHRTNGQIYAWMRSAAGYSVHFILGLDTTWKLVGAGDVNGDGKADLLWSNPGASTFVHWLMNGPAIAAAGAYYVDGAYDAIGSGYFDSNGTVDVVWRHRTNGQIYGWFGSGNSYSVQFIYNLTGWSLLR